MQFILFFTSFFYFYLLIFLFQVVASARRCAPSATYLCSEEVNICYRKINWHGCGAQLTYIFTVLKALDGSARHHEYSGDSADNNLF